MPADQAHNGNQRRQETITSSRLVMFDLRPLFCFCGKLMPAVAYEGFIGVDEITGRASHGNPYHVRETQRSRRSLRFSWHPLIILVREQNTCGSLLA